MWCHVPEVQCPVPAWCLIFIMYLWAVALHSCDGLAHLLQALAFSQQGQWCAESVSRPMQPQPHTAHSSSMGTHQRYSSPTCQHFPQQECFPFLSELLKICYILKNFVKRCSATWLMFNNFKMAGTLYFGWSDASCKLFIGTSKSTEILPAPHRTDFVMA